MIDLWQKVIALAISIAGILTTIYRMVFVKKKKKAAGILSEIAKIIYKSLS